MLQRVSSISDFKAAPARRIDELNEDGGSLVLTQNGSAAAVVLGYEEYQRLQDSIAMMKLMAQADADVAAGRVRPQAEVFADLRSRLQAASDAA